MNEMTDVQPHKHKQGSCGPETHMSIFSKTEHQIIAKGSHISIYRTILIIFTSTIDMFIESTWQRQG